MFIKLLFKGLLLLLLYAAGPEYKFRFMRKHANDNKLTLNLEKCPHRGIPTEDSDRDFSAS